MIVHLQPALTGIPRTDGGNQLLKAPRRESHEEARLSDATVAHQKDLQTHMHSIQTSLLSPGTPSRRAEVSMAAGPGERVYLERVIGLRIRRHGLQYPTARRFQTQKNNSNNNVFSSAAQAGGSDWTARALRGLPFRAVAGARLRTCAASRSRFGAGARSTPIRRAGLGPLLDMHRISIILIDH